MALSVTGDNSLEWHATINIEDFKSKVDELEAKLKANFDKEVQRDLLRKKAQLEYVETITSSAKAYDQLDDRIKVQISDLVDLRGELQRVKEAQATVSEGVSMGQIDTGDAQAMLTSLFVREKQLESAISQTTSEINKQISAGKVGFNELGETISPQIGLINSLKARIGELNSAIGNADKPEAIAQLNAELEKAQAELAKLSNAGKEGFDGMGNAVAKNLGLIDQLKQEALSLQAALHSANTPQEISALNKQLQDVTQQLERLKNAGREGFDEFGNKAEAATEPVQRISQRIRQITNELVGLEAGSERFNSLISEAADLTDKLGDARQQIQLLASDTSHLDAGIQAVQGLAGVFAAAQGAIALFGDENKELEKSLLKVNAAMSIMQGIQQVSALLDKNSALNVFLLKTFRQQDAAATEMEAAANTQLAAAEVEATVATEGLTAAMEANPAGMLLLAISALFVAYQTLSSVTKDAEEEQLNMNAALAEAGAVLNDLVSSFNTLNKQRTEEAENALKLAQSQGKSTNEILQLQLKVTDAKRFEQAVALATLGYDKQSLAIANDQLRSYQEQQLAILDIKAQTGELTKFDQQRLEKLQGQEKALRATLDPANAANEAVKAADQEAANIRAEQAKKAHDDALKSSQAEADARLLLTKKNSKAELDARIADIKTAARVELDNVNLTAGERKKILAQERRDIADATRSFNILQLNNQKSLINAQLSEVEAGTAKELALRIDLLNKSADIERTAEGVTAQRKQEIAAKLAKDVSDLTRKYALDNQKKDVEITVSGIGARLAAVQKGSEQELTLTKQLIDAKASAEIVSAQQQITNQELLVAKIKEINAKARQDEKKADDEYFNNRLQEQIKGIDNETAFKNIPLQAQQNDPLTSFKQKYEAQKQIITNDLDGIQKEINLVGNNIIKNRGDERALKAQLDALQLRKAQLRSELNVLTDTHTADGIKSFAKYAAAAASAFSAIGGSLRPFNEELADVLDKMSGIADVSANVASSFASFASGDISAGISSAVGAVGGVISLIGSIDAKYKKELKEYNDFNDNVFKGEFAINELYRQRTLEQLKINKLRIDGLKAEAAALTSNKDKAVADYKKIADELSKLSYVKEVRRENGFFGVTTKEITETLAGKNFDDLEKLFLTGKLEGKAKELFQMMQKLKQEGIDIDAALEENKQKAKETFTGTTADSITDMIVQGFGNGKRAVEDFADDTESLIRGALLNALKYKALEGPIQKLYDQFAADAESNGGLDLSEVAKFQEGIANAIKNANTMAEQLQQATGVSLSAGSNSGQGNNMSSAIKGMTTQQADLLAGQWGGMRLTMLDQLRVITASLAVQNKIEANTAAAASTLASYYRKWDTQGLKVV